MPNSIEQILELLSGSAPNQSIPGEGGFEVQPPSGGNIPPQSEFIGEALNKLQGAGVAPPLPAETGSGQGTLQMLMQLLQALSAKDEGFEQRQPNPDPGFGMEVPNPDPGFNAPGSAAQGSDANQELLKALLSGQAG